LPDKPKLVPLANFSVTIDPDRVGMFGAICETHLVAWEKTGESYILKLDHNSVLSSLYSNLDFAFKDVPEDNPEGVTTKELRRRLADELATL
jgi:hypothetical protein